MVKQYNTSIQQTQQSVVGVGFATGREFQTTLNARSLPVYKLLSEYQNTARPDRADTSTKFTEIIRLREGSWWFYGL